MRARWFATTPVRSFAVSLACSAALIAGPMGCGTGGVQDDKNQNPPPANTGPSLDQMHQAAMQNFEPAPVVPEGPPSGSYSNYGIECNFPSFFRVSETPGVDFSVVTVANGDSKIIVTVYKDADTSPAPYTKLKEVIERYYGGGTFPKAGEANANARNPLRDPHPETGMYFPDREARKVLKETSGEYRLYDGEDEWNRNLPRTDYNIDRPAVPRSEQGNNEGYTARRVADWGDGEADIFRRTEKIAVVKSNWRKFERPAGNVKFDGLAGMGYYRGERYQVMLETANVPTSDNMGSYMVHIVYIFRMTDEPIMRQVIATFQQSLKFTGQAGKGGAFPVNRGSQPGNTG